MATGTEPGLSLAVLGAVKHVPWLLDLELIFSTWSVSGAVDVSPDFDHPFASGPQRHWERCTWEMTVGARMWEGQQKKKFHLVTLSSDSTLQCCFPRGSKWTAAPNREKKLGSLQTVTKLHCSSYFSLAYYSDTAPKQDHLSCYLKLKVVISSRIAKTWLFANRLTEPSILSSIGRLNG